MSRVILPGATLGMLGSGQLGRMFCAVARRMGYRVRVFSEAPHSPAGQWADEETVGTLTDAAAVARFAEGLSAVSYEFENIPADAAAWVAEATRLHPSAEVLAIAQDRVREKTAFQEAGLPVPRFWVIRSLNDLREAWDDQPAVLKTARWGYDGKGQFVIRSADQLEEAWESLNTDRAVLEEFVDFECELSMVIARGADGSIADYDPFWNHHQNQILDWTVSPAGWPEAVLRDAREIGRALVTHLDLVGVICIEFFLTRNHRLLINEIAPRPHNSGHLTIEAHATSQFEQQLRAMCGLPLGSTTQTTPAAMANLLGDGWSGGVPDWGAAIGPQPVHLHLYGKREPRPGRKMGHLTALGDTSQEALRRVLQARANLFREPSPVTIPAGPLG